MAATCVSYITNVLRQPTIQLYGIGKATVDKKSIVVGNSAVTARCHIEGTEGDNVIKCYYRDVKELEEVYPNCVYREALYVYDIFANSYLVDVVVLKWHPGQSLDRYIYNPECNFKILSRNFDATASYMLDNGVLHGDITAENIIVEADGYIHLIDKIEGNERIYGNGTEAYNNPLRAIFLPNRHVDDYAMALISTLLAAIAIDETLLERLTINGALHIDGTYNDYLISLLEEVLKGRDRVHYDILQTLYTYDGKIEYLANMMRYAVLEAILDEDITSKKVYRL